MSNETNPEMNEVVNELLEEGRKAAYAGKLATANPYDINVEPICFGYWLAGFTEASYNLYIRDH